jgi:hypothetical protein
MTTPQDTTFAPVPVSRLDPEGLRLAAALGPESLPEALRTPECLERIAAVAAAARAELARRGLSVFVLLLGMVLGACDPDAALCALAIDRCEHGDADACAWVLDNVEPTTGTCH